MAPDQLEILTQTVAAKRPCVLTIPGVKSPQEARFLALADTLNIEVGPAAQNPLDSTIKSQTPLKIHFEVDQSVYTFESLPLGRDAGVVRFPLPVEMQVSPRRAQYRAIPESELTVKFWRIPDHFFLRDRPQPSTEFSAQTLNLSTGGMAIHVGRSRTGEPVTLAIGQRLRIQLTFIKEEVIVDARVRYIRSVPPAGQRAGLQFGELEKDVDGRRALARINNMVAHFSRKEIIRNRERAA